MSKLIFATVLALAGIYGTGYLSLSESSANSFLNDWETLTLDGDAHAQCDLLTEDFTVALKDHTTPHDNSLNNNKEEFCAYIKTLTAAMSLLKPTTNVRREDFTVARSLMHPWTAAVTYTEFRTTAIPRAGINQSTQSEDKLILVKTINGVKIQHLESEAWLADK
jgi:hypothetical protein